MRPSRSASLSSPRIAFVASLLPARFLIEHAEVLRVKEIVVLNALHEQSYLPVARSLPGHVAVSRIGPGSWRATVSLVRRLWRAVRDGDRIIFFHECCWPAFDLLVGLLRPTGDYYPQVRMEPGYEPISLASWRDPDLWRRCLALFPVLRKFRVYRSPKLSGQAGYAYYLSYREYPSTIATHPVGPRRQAHSIAPPAAGERARGEVLFVVGIESMPDHELRGVYERLISAALLAGYAVAIKDHPIYPLNVKCDRCRHIDATIPAELLDEPFAFAIGIASTALLGVGARKVSIVHALQGLPTEIRQLRVAYLQSLPGFEQIEFASSIEDVITRLQRPAIDSPGH